MSAPASAHEHVRAAVDDAVRLLAVMAQRRREQRQADQRTNDETATAATATASEPGRP